jgi:serine phosphatase RsbU (regulator of sigma subunit)
MKLGFLNTGFPKITLAFVLVIFIVIANVVFNYFIIKKNKATVAEMTEVINPYIESLEEFNLVITESKMYVTNWVYLQNSLEDKKSLENLINFHYPELKTKLNAYVTRLNKKVAADSLSAVFKKFELLVVLDKEVMSLLVTFDDYENPTKKFECEEIIESEVLPRTRSIMKQLGRILYTQRKEAREMKSNIQESSERMMKIMMAASVGLFAFIMIAVFFISNGIRKPVLKMKDIIQQLGRGELPKEKMKSQNNVVGEMASSVNALTESFTQTSQFANEIEKGNLHVQYDKLSENDLLGNALINMRDALGRYSQDMEQQVSDRTKEVREKSTKLEFAYREIRDSINYAKRIQESILPADENITQVFGNSFIFYRPKDVVCGDFYWFSQKDDEAIIAAVDCTGHGVPGAFMTVIGNSLLNQIVNFSGITDPGRILTQLDKKLHETLQQHGNIITNDGMDAAVCRYKINKREITFSGAKRPLYVFKQGELIEIKGNKSPIGSFGHSYDKLFSEHKINVNKNDTVYLFSDGVQDQFGGADGKKFMIKRFREMLSDIQAFPMKEQLARIEKEMALWQNDYEQTDDMLLIGIRF